MHSEICPVCKGTGKVTPEGSSKWWDKPCHGCNGKGWVEVQDPPIEIDDHTHPWEDIIWS